MSEPGIQASPSAAPREHLWDKASAWRSLTIGASLLTMAAIALPLALPQQPADVPATPVATVRAPAPAAAIPAQQQVAIPAPQPAPVPIAPPEAPKAVVHPLKTASLPHARHSEPSEGLPTMPQMAIPLPAIPQSTMQQNLCPLRQNPQAIPAGSGVVIGFFTDEQTRQRVASDEQRLGGTINPNYATSQRVVIRPDFETRNRLWISALPQGMHVTLGDHVTYNTAFRDLSLPCSYVPTLVTGDQGPVEAMQQQLPQGPQ